MINDFVTEFPRINVYGFMLALQWPNSYCNSCQCKHPIPQQLKTHGFWALDRNGHVMTNEEDYMSSGEVGLNEQDVADIKIELDEMWPNLRGNNFDFWDYEWRRHGHGIIFSDPNSYFKSAIRCKRKLDDIIGGELVEYLRQIVAHYGSRPTWHTHGFGPTAIADYANQQFPIKIKKKTNFNAGIKCYTADGKSQLLEIYICFTRKEDFADCKCKYEGKKEYYIARDCERRIIFPIKREPQEELLRVVGTRTSEQKLGRFRSQRKHQT
ncbi:ribonuclease S-7-like [Olea europaea var. sylvestris]|uniref:ribonuclease S-7-like n=1 Tax=Olea europaea var. sylvestris TaxID=158386 RepID=UPI000C1D106C|nr:ribonuclease S-7-like [Olea europaea var. sylvestris]